MALVVQKVKKFPKNSIRLNAKVGGASPLTRAKVEHGPATTAHQRNLLEIDQFRPNLERGMSWEKRKIC
jgi:hypothetical protein